MRAILPLLAILALSASPISAQVTATKINAKINTTSTTVLDNTLTSVALGTPDDSATAKRKRPLRGRM